MFFATSLGLAVLAGYDRAPTSVIDTLPLSAPPTQPSAPGEAPAGPGVLEQLQRMQGDAPRRAAGAAVPLTATHRWVSRTGRETGPSHFHWRS